MSPRDVNDLRRLNHLVGEDFYFLSYSILLALHVLAPNGASFRDDRKLAHVIQLVSDSRLLSILDRSQDKPIENAVDRELLFAAFSKAESLKREIYKLLLSMDRRGMVVASLSKATGSIDVSLNAEEIGTDFIENKIFDQELANAGKLRILLPKLRIMTMETFLDRVYSRRGVRAWAL